MLPTKWEPFDDTGGFVGHRPHPRSWLDGDLSADIYEERGKFVVKMSMPIVNLEDLDISLEDDVFTIFGRREEESALAEKDYYSKEIRRGSFHRSIKLPKSVNASEAQATYENGLLIVTIPIIVGAEERAVKIPIRT
jgi:HSP20 family protein